MDPNPFKHPAIILSRMRKAIEPSLFVAGFQFDGRNKPSIPVYLYLDYSRPGELVRLAWDRRDSNRFIGVTAELLGPAESVTIIAASSLSGIARLPKGQVTAEVRMRLDAFAETVNAFLKRLASAQAP